MNGVPFGPGVTYIKYKRFLDGKLLKGLYALGWFYFESVYVSVEQEKQDNFRWECEVRKHWVFLCFFKQLPNSRRGGLHKRDLLTRLHPKPHSPALGHAQPLSQHPNPETWWSPWAVPAQRDDGGGGGWRDAQATWGVSEGFLPSRCKPGCAASYSIQQTNSVLALLISPDVFSASTTWACNRKIFIAQRIRCRGKPAFRCKYRIEGYVVFAFLNANKKALFLGPCGRSPQPWLQHVVVILVPAGRLPAAGRPAFSPARRTLVCHWDCFASSPAWFGSCEDKSRTSTWWGYSSLWSKAARSLAACHR